MRFTAGDHYLLNAREWIKKVWSKPLSEDVSWQRIEFEWVKIFNGESDSSGITDPCSGCGRPYITHPTTQQS